MWNIDDLIEITDIYYSLDRWRGNKKKKLSQSEDAKLNFILSELYKIASTVSETVYPPLPHPEVKE